MSIVEGTLILPTIYVVSTSRSYQEDVEHRRIEEKRLCRDFILSLQLFPIFTRQRTERFAWMKEIFFY